VTTRLLALLFERLGHRYAPIAIIAVAILLSASSLSAGRCLDDWIFAVVNRGEGAALGLAKEPWDCFTFATGNRSENASLMARGVLLPWWTDPELRLAFFRPLAAATHLLDETWWPAHPQALHAHNLFWFAALLAGVAAVYRKLAGDWQVSSLALALYAWDDARGATLSWIANRNALISGALGCGCIAAHVHWRRGNRAHYGLLSWVLFLLSGLASELAVGALAYLIAYAVFLDGASRRSRVLSVLGYAVATLGWRIGWSVAGYGARGSGAYIDPLRDPLGFLASAPRRWLCLLQGQFGLIPADFGFLAPGRDQLLWACTAVATLAAAAFFLRPCVTDPLGRFWLGGSLLALLPMAATVPSDRLLLFVGLGFMALLARAFRLSLAAIETSSAAKAPVIAGLLPLGFFLVHGVIAPLLLPFRAAQMGRMARAERQALQDLRAQSGPSGKTVIILNAPSVVLASYALAQLKTQGLPTIPRLYVLSAADSTVVVTRTGPLELSLRAERGFLRTHLERLYRATPASLGARAHVELGQLTADVTESLADGHPSVVRFTLEGRLSDYAFVCWIEGSFRSCTLPGPGEKLQLAPDDLGRVLFATEAEASGPRVALGATP
jgi:hypothetical protein